VNSIRARLPRLLSWLSSAQPDVVCLQEVKCSADDVPTAEFAALGYQLAVNSTGRWNGVRHPVEGTAAPSRFPRTAVNASTWCMPTQPSPPP